MSITNADKTIAWLEINNFIQENVIAKYPNVCNNIENEILTQIFIFSTPTIKSIISDWMDSKINFDFHNFNYSTKYKNLGNLAYESNKYENCYKAANFYTKALFHAPEEGNLSGICHSNRAAALIIMGYYEEAFDDCICALELGYDNLFKIYYRQATCAISMRNVIKLKESIINLEGILTKTNQLLQKDLERFKNELKHLQEASAQRNIVDIVKDQYVETKKQKIVSSNDKGRYVLADETIYKDDEIMTEEAFAFVPTYTISDSINILELNCINCGKENIIPFPCYKCLHAFYCSIECRNKQSLIHSFECKGMIKDLFNEIGIGYLAFKTLLIGFPELKEYCNKVLNENSTSNQIWNEINNYGKENLTNYSSVLNLMTNFDKSTMSVKDYLHYSLTGTMLAIYLSKYTNFFSYDRENLVNISCANIWQIVVAALITRHIGQMISNAHTINKLNFNANKWDKSAYENIWKQKNHLNPGNLYYFKEIVPIFTAIYPKISMYNHSCEPSYRNRLNKISLSVIANNNLNIGDEILNSYGIDCRKTHKNNRLRHLMEQYHFTCDCVNCKNVEEHKFKRNRLLKCSNTNCNYEFYPKKITHDSEIWMDEIVYDNNLRISCPKCETQWKFNWYKLFKIEIENIYNRQNLAYENLKTIYDLYQIGNKFLSEFHLLKLKMAKDVVNNIIFMIKGGLILKSNWLEFVIPICANMMKCAENYYGLYDLQFIMYAIYCLDLIVALKNQNHKIQIDYELGKIKESFEILPDRTKLIFDSYFNDYLS